MKISAFITELQINLKTKDSISTQLGEFVVRREQGITGRNPRTGEKIKTPSKNFYYLIPSEFLIKEVFGNQNNLKEILEKNRSETLKLIENRFGPYTSAKSEKLDIDKDLLTEIIQQLKTNKKVDFSFNNFSGKLKLNEQYFFILFSASAVE
jgi:nucleoid DNA-binding protein